MTAAETQLIASLTELVAEQGRQIIELSKALAIAHEVHSGVSYAPPPQLEPVSERRMYLTEEEEDEAFASGDMQHEDTRRALEEIVAATGMTPPITLVPS